jgi:hypothetical protein
MKLQPVEFLLMPDPIELLSGCLLFASLSAFLEPGTNAVIMPMG